MKTGVYHRFRMAQRHGFSNPAPGMCHLSQVQHCQVPSFQDLAQRAGTGLAFQTKAKLIFISSNNTWKGLLNSRGIPLPSSASADFTFDFFQLGFRHFCHKNFFFRNCYVQKCNLSLESSGFDLKVTTLRCNPIILILR